MKKLFLLCCMLLCCMSATCFAAAQKIAVVPYLDTTEEQGDKDYLPDFMYTYYDDAMAQLGLEVIPEDDVAKSLKKAGYDVSNQMIPDKDILAEVAKSTGADYVVAAELASLKDTKHIAFFQAKISVTTKLRYNFYIAKTDKVMAFQVTGADENKAVIGGIGTKSPINNALRQATEQANEKIKGYIADNNNVNVSQ